MLLMAVLLVALHVQTLAQSAEGYQSKDAYLKDITDCTELTHAEWSKKGKMKKIIFSAARLVSEFL